MIYATAITTIKLFILLFYERVFINPKFKLATRSVGVFCIAWWIAVVILQIFECRPVEGFWNGSPTAKCINPSEYYIGVTVPNILTDAVILCLPFRMIWHLHSSTFQKFALSLTFLTGAL